MQYIFPTTTEEMSWITSTDVAADPGLSRQPRHLPRSLQCLDTDMPTEKKKQSVLVYYLDGVGKDPVLIAWEALTWDGVNMV
jgi:hypothetical protein